MIAAASLAFVSGCVILVEINGEGDIIMAGTEAGTPVNTETTSHRERLRLLPSHLYSLKAGAVRTRSAAWLARSRFRRRDRAGMRILFYHRVSTDADELCVTPKRFCEQMDYLAANGYQVVDIADAARILDEEAATDRVIGLSFDDGYLDLADGALPVLARHGFRATVFIVTGVVDGTAVFDWYSRPPPVLSWQQIVELDGRSPFRFEAHTVTHPNLLTLNEHQARREMVDSKHALEQRLGRSVEAFSYPAGLYGAREQRLVQEAGYRVAVSCEPGLNDFATDRFALRRNQIDRRDRLIDFRAKVGGGHDRPLPLRALYRRMRYGAVAG
jgi:peptidoglycan/xylan/chitin deacetylase (PgdA/CDA1 family)